MQPDPTRRFHHTRSQLQNPNTQRRKLRRGKLCFLGRLLYRIH